MGLDHVIVAVTDPAPDVLTDSHVARIDPDCAGGVAAQFPQLA